MTLIYLFIKFIIFMGALLFASDKLVDAMSRVAKHFKIPSVIIGSTIVGIGTSLPEVASGISANIANKSEIVISNVLGSNVINVFTLILTFLIVKNINIDIKKYKKTLFWFIASAIIFYLVLNDGRLIMIESYTLIALFVIYLYSLFRNSKEHKEEIQDEINSSNISVMKEIIISIIAGVVIVFGANEAISSAIDIAMLLEVSDWIIGILLVAIGTSLPEFTVSIISAYKGDIGMSIGNILGSNIANILLVLGVSSFINEVTFDESKYIIDIVYFMLMSSVLVMFFIFPKFVKYIASFGMIIFIFYIRHII